MKQIMTLTGRGLALSVLALSLAACQTMRGPEPTVQADIPESYTMPASGESVAEQGYKDFFADPRLTQVLDLALANNRDLRTATLNIQRAQQQYQISENALFPIIGANGGVVRQDQGQGSQTRYNVGLGITAFEADFWGRIRSLKDNALDQYLATASARDATQITLIGQVAQAWLSYSYANTNLKLAEQTLKAQEESYRLNKRRFDVGIDSELPSRQAQISVETAKSDVAAYKAQIEQAQNLLNLLVGQQVPQDLLPKQQVKRITSSEVLNTGLPSDLLLNRPDLRAAELRLSAAGANIGAAKAAMFPTIRLTGSAGYGSTELSDLFKSGSFVWSFGPTLDLPIWDMGIRRANVKISETDQQIMLSGYEKSIQSAFREVNDALAVRKTIDDRVNAQRRLVEATNTTYSLSEKRFRAGIDNYLTVLDAQRASYASQQGLLLLEQAKLNNQIEIYKTLGGGIKANTGDTVAQGESSAEQRAAKDAAKNSTEATN